MKLQEFLAINGARATAEKLVNMRIQYATGLSMSDLPDRNEFWDIVEDIEEELNELNGYKERFEALEKIKGSDYEEAIAATRKLFSQTKTDIIAVRNDLVT